VGKRSATFDSMRFLNEAAERYPHAISLAAGRPPSHLLGAAKHREWIDRFVGMSAGSAAWDRLGQYGPTNGMICELIAAHLRTQEGVEVAAADCIVTNGFQEALVIELMALRGRGGAVIAMEPTYVGLAGAASAIGLPLLSFPSSERPALALVEAAARARSAGHRSLAFYIIPDFANPTGASLDLAARRELLEVAKSHDILILEDTAYRMFRYEGEHVPSLLALDEEGCVVWLGTFSKTLVPGLRIGYSIARATSDLRDLQQLASLKSFLSVNTCTFSQAAVGGFLLEQQFDLGPWVAPRVAFCRASRNAMLQQLEVRLGNNAGVAWARPAGGFFIVVDLPFVFEGRDLEELVRTQAVIVTPMTFFSPSGGYRSQMRLAFSNVDGAAAVEGVDRLSHYIGARSANQVVTRQGG